VGKADRQQPRPDRRHSALNIFSADPQHRLKGNLPTREDADEALRTGLVERPFRSSGQRVVFSSSCGESQPGYRFSLPFKNPRPDWLLTDGPAATSCATGAPRLVRKTSSPFCTASTRQERLLFASLIPISTNHIVATLLITAAVRALRFRRQSSLPA
jgi:hypothetical protein